MKRATAVLCLAGAACSFPDFHVAHQPVSCDDEVRNGAETGVDCGIAACGVPCPVGQGCDGDSDCSEGACTDGVCRAASCDDGLKNGAESDRDCGGDEGCQRCAPGQRCQSSDDCDGGACAKGQCREPSCEDALRNGDETDLDCGGSCEPCGVDQRCESNDDCDALACVKGSCRAASCDDGVWNQDETDLDCGGGCEPCLDELRCKLAGDCESGVCPKQTLRCAIPTCDDGILNGDEPSVDCGASCSDKCGVLATCNAGADCATGLCSSTFCVPSEPTDEALSRSGWVATASHTMNGSDPQNALDGSTASNWITGTDQLPGMSFTLDMLTPQVFFSIELVATSEPQDAATKVDVWLSSDGSFTTPALKNVVGSALLKLSFPEAQVARYIKISLSNDVSSDRWWRIDELRVRQ